MLVPLELYNLTRKRTGYLSPDLAIGWKIGTYVKELFDGLQEVRMAVAVEDDAAFALSHLSRDDEHFDRITVPDTPRPWDFLFYHTITGTVLNFTLIRKHVELPENLRSLQSRLFEGRPEVVEKYRVGLDLLVSSILKREVDSFSIIRRIRCRRLLHAPRYSGSIRCFCCGIPVPVRNAWDIEGQMRCQACSGLELAWITDE